MKKTRRKSPSIYENLGNLICIPSLHQKRRRTIIRTQEAKTQDRLRPYSSSLTSRKIYWILIKMKNNLGNNQDSFRNSGQTAVVLLPLIDEDITQVDIREKRRKEEKTT